MRLLPLPALFAAWAVFISPAATADVTPARADAALFDYDPKAPLELQDLRQERRDNAVVHEITFSGGHAPVSALLVRPEESFPSTAGILYVHWLGDPETTNRTEFLNEAVALTSEGIVSLLVNAMWAEPKWYDHRVPEEDHAHSVQQVIALRRALDVLLSQPGMDPKRIALVGHDFGAMYGAVMGAVDRRPTTYVLMAGTPHFADWFLFARQPKSLDEYRKQISTLDPIHFVGDLAPAPVFFQFASRDEYVTPDAASRFYAAARPRKQSATYAVGHDLRTTDATADRVAWLIRLLGAKTP